MTFISDIGNFLRIPAIPGIPHSTIGDIFGIGNYLGIPSIDEIFGSASGVVEGAKDKVSSISKNLPYIIIGGGALVLIILLKR